VDENRFDRDLAESKRKKAMLYVTAFLAILLFIGFLLD
jgi:hypothetical protein